MNFINWGRISGDGVWEEKHFNVGSNLQLLLKFPEKGPNLFCFFSLFEQVAESCGWSDGERTLLLQCVLMGKAQEAYVSLNVTESKKYDVVKTRVTGIQVGPGSISTTF